MATVVPKRLSLAEFLALPEQASETAHLELLYGEVVEMAKPTWEHNELILGLGSLLKPYLRKHSLGRVSTDCLVVLDETEAVAVAPDMVYLSPERIHLLQRGRVYGAPDLVVEVFSPSSEVYDRVRKMQVYHRYQVPWVWLIALEPLHLEEYQWSQEGYTLVGAVAGDEPFRPRLFPELSLTLTEL